MHLNFSSHKADKNLSSFDVFNYLEKENLDKNFSENFFNGDVNFMELDDPNNKIDMLEAVYKIDNNKGILPLKSSNFFLMNLSPSEKELLHLQDLADQELKRRGLDYNLIIKSNDPNALTYYNEQREELLKVQLKLYLKDVMDKYADLMDREIYADQNNLPDSATRKNLRPLVNALYQDFLKEKGISSYQNDVEFKEINYSNLKEVEKGVMFNVFDEQGQHSIFLPSNKFTLTDDKKLLVDELFYNSKYNEILEKKELDNSLISLSSFSNETKETKEIFTDCINEDKIIIQYDWKNENTKLDLYFDKANCTFQNGKYSINTFDYEEVLRETKIKFLNKKYPEERQNLFDEYAVKQGWDLSKIKDDKGNLVYSNPNLVPTSEQLKKANTAVSVEFNNWLIKNNHIEDYPQDKITDWNTTKTINATILVESEKAKLLEFYDERLGGTAQRWIGNFAIKEENLDLGTFDVLENVYENELRKEVARKSSSNIEFSEYQEIRFSKTKLVRGQESISFKIFEPSINEDVKLNIKKEDLIVQNDGYSIAKYQFDTKYKNAFYEHCKDKFKSDYEKISDQVSKDLVGQKQRTIDKKVTADFKRFLNEQGIKVERNDQYNLEAKILESKDNSTQISYKSDKYENEVVFWVNNNQFEKENGKLLFKNTEKINSLIDKAIERDKAQKQLVPIPFEQVEVREKSIKGKEEKEAILYFTKKENGLTNPIQFSIKKDDVVEKDGKYFTSQYNLNNKLEKGINNAVIKEYGKVKENIKHKIWEDLGYSTEKRKITGDDLLYFAKIEHNRTYKFSDKNVQFNNEIYKQISETKSNSKKLELEKKLLVDKHTGEIIKEGNQKGGLNYHVHTVISRHDKTSVLPEDKVSMSPNSNQKDSIMGNGAKVGFERTEFFKETERIFDQKFNYQRPANETFEYKNTMKKNLVVGNVKSFVKDEFLKHTGINEVKNTLNPVQSIKSQISEIPIPTSIPTNQIQAIMKAVKMLKSAVIDKGMSI